MQDQVFTDGEIIEHKGVTLECSSVSYQEDEEGNRHSFVYTFRTHEEMEAEREAARPETGEEVPQDERSDQLKAKEDGEA